MSTDPFRLPVKVKRRPCLRAGVVAMALCCAMAGGSAAEVEEFGKLLSSAAAEGPVWPGERESVIVELVSGEMADAGESVFIVTDQPGLSLDDESIQLIATASNATHGPPWARRRFPRLARAGHALVEDYRNFYSCEGLTCLVGAFGAGALMANTGFDTTMQDAWLTGVEPTGLGTFFSGCKDIGEGRYAVPIFGTAAVAGLLFEKRPLGRAVGEWGSRSIRMFAVGAPPLYALQWATGASRPVENLAGSDWKPFQDSNGVSGHAFVGAIPFIAAADMVESPLAKGTLYVCSTFVAFSRINDNAHYPSQAFLGWYLALASSRAVSQTQLEFAGMEVRMVPLPIADQGGMALETRW